MYHKADFFTNGGYAYYDTIEEMPKTAKVYFPNEEEPKEMTAEEMMKLSKEGWYTIMHSCNYGSCDYWTTEKLSKWVDERFLRIRRYVRKGETMGYNRDGWSVRLTKDAHYWKSAVWNS